MLRSDFSILFSRGSSASKTRIIITLSGIVAHFTG